jgi:hypothetical protein
LIIMTTPASAAIPLEADERQPLLNPQASSVEHDAVPEEFDSTVGQSEAILRPKKTRSKVQIAWYILLTLISAFVLAVFIKGWMDSDDVDVRKRIALL